ncbi:hypothetical protein PYW08_002157 [Mythimna loreyi]|uniref:Uncharacterized protein n=5 Tax=Mythimna loreyi TaxID=667449 RepID=A0ACC2QFV7_9NEOP|nr:hypothetical protein PYW08_011283 [Mythimna loreyi]KAJ8716041.1 hypothetical protein PYW08_013326 [Mythimna loreyi]KAJ8719751.1 hypothetical protein PYW08_011926 [Mythimna loreyi]KAJ8729464.1 hypothetical protein PYW08_001045 [Mythimna loreyi]KAJ8730744.1 hypothetical protein PYW08_002157 [Mythimna loreyi]
MSALQALLRYPFKSKPPSPLIAHIRNKLFDCVVKGFSVVFVWIPSHCGIKGNEKADRLANEAVVCGDTVPFKNYCQDLATLPRHYLRDSWDKVWAESSCSKGKYYFSIQSQIPRKPWFSILRLGKIATTILIRMRLGHTTCPVHLARFHIIDSPQCECGHDFGDLNHIFFSCPIHDRTSFLYSLITLRVPFPTSIQTLLFSFNPSIYSVLSDYIYENNIRL